MESVSPDRNDILFCFWQKPGNKKDTVESGKQLLKTEIEHTTTRNYRYTQIYLQREECFISQV